MLSDHKRLKGSTVGCSAIPNDKDEGIAIEEGCCAVEAVI